MKRARMILAAGIAVAAVVATPIAPAKTPSTAGPASPAHVTQAPSYSGHVEPIFLKHCHSCHSTDTPKGDLILDPGTGFRALVERGSIQVPATKLVAPGDVEASYLWAKLQGNVTVGKGMPRTLFSAKKLAPKDLELIRQWIATGALP